MGKTSLAAFMAVCPKLDTLKVKGRGAKSLDNFVAWAKEEFPQLKEIIVCKDNEEAIRDSDIISFTTTVLNDVSTFPEIKEEWVKKGALISMPSAARFDSKEFVAKRCKMVVDNYSLYEAREEE